MASRNLKPKNSSDSEGEAEWTFIDTDEGTIETRKDSVTYRKPTYSEILKGVVAEDLAEEVDSEPEFEVLASFKFRPKGESFGLGSSAPKPPKNANAQGKGSGHEVDDDDESPNGDDSSCSDDGIMIISSHLTGEDKADEDSNSKVPLQASNDNDCNKINNAGSMDDNSKDKETDADKNTHDEDDDFVMTDETESDFEEATMNNTPDDNEDDDKECKKDVELDKETLSESTADSLNASTIKEATPLNEESYDNNSDSDSDNHDNNDDGFLGIHKGGICDNPEKDLDWDSLTFQLLSTLPRLSLSTSTLEDDNKNPRPQDGTIDSIQDSDSESDSHSSYAAISQDDKQGNTSSFDELSDSADVNRDFSSEPMIPQWLFNADKDAEDEIESFDDDSDYIISDIEELKESGLIPQWFFDPSHKVHVDKSVDGGFELINSDLDDLNKDPVIPVCIYNPSYKVIDTNGSFNDDVEENNPIIPEWFFDPNYKIQDLNEMFDDDTDYTDYTDYDSDDDHDSSMTLPRWLFDKNFKPPDQNEEEFSWPSQLFVDIPTFIILLCLTTALGFSIGHGLTVYLSNQSINRNAKLQNIETPAKQFPSSLEDLGLTPEEIARIDLLRLEDELHQQKEADMLSNHLRFDLREIYKSLKDKHYRLLRNQKSTEDRLHISKTMSWYWRMRYDEEKRRNEVTGLPTNLRPKNFKDMANLARKTKLAKKWRRQYKENYTAQGLGKSNPLNSNLKWLVKSLDATLKQDKRLGSRYLMKAMALSKDKDMKNFRKRWTQDLKDLKQRSCCSYPTNKSIQLKNKTAVSSPFTWVNDSRDCKRAKRSDILGLCLTKKSSLEKTKINNPTAEKPAKKDSGRKNDVKFRPCFSKPKNNSKIKQTSSKNKGKLSSRVSRDPKRSSVHRANRQEKVRSDRIKKRELKKKALEIKNQVDELKAVLVELRRERRRAEKEKAKLEASWRKLKRQRLQFEKERKEKQKSDEKKNKKVTSKLTREKTRLKTWKNVAKRAQKKAHTLHKNLKRVSVAKQELKDIKNIKKNLKIEKRKLREQQKNLKSIKRQLRKEHRNYARERWKTKKKRRQLEKQRINESEPIKKKNKAKKQDKTSTNRKKAEKHQSQRSSTKRSQDKKKQKPQKKFWENLEKSLYEWAQKVNRTIEYHRRGKASKVWKKLRAQFDKFVAWTKEPKEKENKVKKQEKTRTNGIKTEKRKREQSSNKHSEDKNKKQAPRKKFWENVEKSLYEWAQKVNRTIRHHRRGKASKIWKKLRAQFNNLVAWTTGKYSKATGPVKKKKEHHSKNKIKSPVFEKILAEQIKYDEEKRNSQKDSENQWKSRSPVVNKNKIKVHDVKKKKKKKKERKKKDPETSLKQRQRKQRRKYQRELERLQQWALQMNEKKLEHERIYRKKEKKSRKRFKSERTHSKPGTEEDAAKGRDLVSVEDSNSTFMLLLQSQASTSADYKTPKDTRKEKSRYQDKESIIREVTKSQINHELNKKNTQTGVTLPLEDDVIKLPDDVNNGKEPSNPLDVTSFGDESRSGQEPTPPSFSPTFYKDFPIIGIINDAKRKRDGSIGEADILSSDSPKVPENSQNGGNGQRTDPWYMRRAEQREEFHDTDTGLTLSPRLVGPLKSDGTWFFQRSSDRALQRKLYEPLNRQSTRDGFKHNAWRSYFHRGRLRSAMNDGEWVFERASDRAEQRSNDEPWYMRRAEGRKEDREENKDSWFIERGFDRDILHHYDEDDEDDDLMNDYDNYADHGFDEEYEDPWF